jgi:hypothetical protein
MSRRWHRHATELERVLDWMSADAMAAVRRRADAGALQFMIDPFVATVPPLPSRWPF